MRLPLLLAAALTVSGPVSAQVLDFKPDATLACMEKQKMPGADIACVGEAARACFQKLKSPAITDIAACLQSEAAYWKDRMDKAYAQMMDEGQKADAAFAKTDESKLQKARLTTDLEKERAEWETWHQTRCWIEAGMRRGTPYRVTAAATCTMKQMAERAMFYESAVKYMQTR